MSRRESSNTQKAGIINSKSVFKEIRNGAVKIIDNSYNDGLHIDGYIKFYSIT